MDTIGCWKLSRIVGARIADVGRPREPMTPDESLPGPDTELWCAGLRLVRRKPLDGDERSALQARARKALGRSRALKVLTTTAAIVASIGVGLLVFGSKPLGVRDGASVAFAGIGIALVACGFIGAVAEVVVGRTLLGRAFFLVSGVVALVGGPWRFVTAPFALVAGNVGLVVIIFLGNAMMVLRWREGRREHHLFRRALEDIARGEVLAFEAPVATQQRSVGQQLADDESGAGPTSAEVLPSSNLAVRIDGQPVRSWLVMPVLVVAKAPDARLDAPYSQRPEWLSGESQAPRQRHLTREEVKELSRVRKSTLRRIPFGTLAVGYFAAVIARIVENLLRGQLAPELSAAGWGLAVLVAAGYALKQSLFARRLKADTKAAMAIVLLSDDDGSRGTISEILPESGLHWIENGAPAGWRTAR